VRVIVVDRTVVSDFDTCIAAILYNAHRSPYRRLYRRFCFGDVIFTARRYMLARYVLWPCIRLCLFATKTAKRRITQRKPDDSRGPVVVREYTHAYAVYTAPIHRVRVTSPAIDSKQNRPCTVTRLCYWTVSVFVDIEYARCWITIVDNELHCILMRIVRLCAYM